MIDQNLFGKRQWVKLWVGEWLDGTTRYEMTGAQRAFWIDLLAMAGRSRQPGIICAGYSGDRLIGYPLSHFQALDAGGELDIPATLQLFEACGKIRIEVTQEAPIRLLKVEIANWGKYQSNLAGQAERSRRYRENKQKQSPATASRDVSRSRHAEKSHCVTGVEGEGEVDKTALSEPKGSDEQVSRRTPQKEPSAQGVELAQLLRQRILENNPKSKTADSWERKWAIEADRMIARDNRTPAEIREVIEFSQGSSFWRANILSMGKLREKFDQLWMKRNESAKPCQVKPGPVPQRFPIPQLDDAGRAIYAQAGVKIV